MKYKTNELNKIKNDCLKTILGMHKKANAGHIGSSLSCLDILVYLFFQKLKSKDKFILSKGHAATTLYAVLARSGMIPAEMLETFHKDATLLAAHPPCGNKVNGILFGTGSLGHGLSLAAGIALSAKFTKKKFKVYCVLSDGDCNEGSTWEAALFAAQHKLNDLTVIIDNNGIQGFGRTKEVLNLEPLAEKWRSFNFEVAIAKNGNDMKSLEKAFSKISKKASNKPKCIIARTIKGSGVPFMEDKIEWHYLPMDEKQYETAIKGMIK